ncbi:MAG: hypothetical protein ACHREM_13480 [Polyangiales bacterium]
MLRSALPDLDDRDDRFGRWLWLLPIAVTLFAFRSVGTFEFAADARMLILDNGYLQTGSAWDQVRHDYFWSSSGSIIPYWRPWTKLSWWLEWRAFGPHAPSFVWVSVLWHCLGVAGVQRLALDLRLHRYAAFLVAIAFALHPVTVEPVSMIMARSDVVAAAGMVWSVIAFRRWALGTRHRGRWLLVHGLATMFALASKEVAATIPLLIAGFAVTELEPTAQWRGRARAIGLALAPSVLMTVVYLVVRRHLLALEHPDLPKTSLDTRWIRPFASLAFYAQGAFPLAPSSIVRDLPMSEAKSAWFVARALATWIAMGAGLWLGFRRDRRLLPLLGWSIVALLPVVLTRDISVPVGPGKLALADRWLYAALAPSLLAWAIVVESFVTTVSRAKAALAGMGVWSLYLLSRSTEDRGRLASELAMLDDEDRVFDAIPAAHRTLEDRCRVEERKVARALMKDEPQLAYTTSADALAVCGRTPERVSDLLDAAVRTQRWVEASSLADEAVAHPPRDPRGNRRLTFDIGTAFVARGRGVDGERWLGKTVELGTPMCALPWIAMAEATRARKDIPGAAKRLENAYECGGKRDPSLLIAGATWLADAGESDRARALLGRAAGHTLSPDQAAQAAMVSKALGPGP